MENIEYIWSYNGESARFASSKVYSKLIGQHPTNPAFSWVQNPCQNPNTRSCWLLLKDRLSTGIYSEESIWSWIQMIVKQLNIFSYTLFAQQFWGLINLAISSNGGTFDNFNALKDQISSQFFMVAIALMCWIVWLARNEIIFNVNQISIQDCRRIFFKEAKMVSLRMKTKSSLSTQFDQWMQSLEMI